MKMIIVVALAVAAVAVAAPAESPEPPKILRSEFDQQPSGAFQYSFETENGIQQQATGEVKNVRDEENKEHEVVVIRGSYSYTDPEGKPVSINWFADETGFHPEGESIPKVPARR